MRILGMEIARRRSLRDRLEWFIESTVQRLDRLETAPEPDQNLHELILQLNRKVDELEAELASLGTELSDVHGRLKATNFAVSEGIERTDRAERRIHATIKRARKELAARGLEDPGVEAEAYELRAVDGGGGGEGELPAVPEDVGENQDEPSSIAGVPASKLRRIRGW